MRCIDLILHYFVSVAQWPIMHYIHTRLLAGYLDRWSNVVRVWVVGLKCSVTGRSLQCSGVCHWLETCGMRCSITLTGSKQCKVVWRCSSHRWNTPHNRHRSVLEGGGISGLVNMHGVRCQNCTYWHCRKSPALFSHAGSRGSFGYHTGRAT